MSTDDYHDYENNEDNNKHDHNQGFGAVRFEKGGGGDIDSDNFRGSGSSGNELKKFLNCLFN